MPAKRKSKKIGNTYGQFLLLDTYHEKDTIWVVRCIKCGKVQEKARHSIEQQTTECVECGKPIKHRNTTGHYNERIRHIYTTMLQRTSNPKKEGYERYGGRGIKVCEEWQDDFQNFYSWAMANGYTDKLTIDRIDVNGDYCPENCRWVDAKTQMNNRRSNKVFTIGGKTKTVAQWAEQYGIDRYTVYNRLRLGWSIERALTEPIDTKKISKKESE